MTVKVSLKLRHPSLDLAEVARELGFPVGRIWTAGKERRTPKGEALQGVHQGSYCALRVDAPEASISGAITAVDEAFSRAGNLGALLLGGELEKTLYCTLLKDGESIDSDSLARLVKWRIRLEID